MADQSQSLIANLQHVVNPVMTVLNSLLLWLSSVQVSIHSLQNATKQRDKTGNDKELSNKNTGLQVWSNV